MIAGVIATEVVNLITGKTPPLAVPTVIQSDALLRKYRRSTYPMGMRGPLQLLKKPILKKTANVNVRMPEFIRASCCQPLAPEISDKILYIAIEGAICR